MAIPGMAALVAQNRGGGPPAQRTGYPPRGNKGGPPPPQHGAVGGHQDARQVAQAQAQRIHAGKIDQQLLKLMRSFDPHEDGYPPWALDEQLWQQAEAAVQPAGAGKQLCGNEESAWLCVAHTYKALGGKINGGNSSFDQGQQQEPVGDEGDPDFGGQPDGQSF